MTKKKDKSGNIILDKNNDPILENIYSVKTGTIFTINTKDKKLYKDEKEVCDLSNSFTPQKMEFMKAGGSYAVVFGKKLQSFAAKILNVEDCQYLLNLKKYQTME